MAVRVDASKPVAQRLPLDLGDQSLRMRCLGTSQSELVRVVMPGPCRALGEEGGEFRPHEGCRLHVVVIGVGHEQLPQVFHFFLCSFRLVLHAPEVAITVDVVGLEFSRSALSIKLVVLIYVFKVIIVHLLCPCSCFKQGQSE